jgi:hypothetical protein
VYEKRIARPVSRTAFLRRLAQHLVVASMIVLGSLGAGMAGYRYFEGLGWRDAFLNAAMLLGGMGPVETPVTPGGKLFAGFYALDAGLVFIVAVGIIAAPVAHRQLHQFHWEDDDASRGPERR